MGSGYKAQPEGMAAIVAEFKSIHQAQAALNRRITALGIQVDPATDSIVLPPGRSVRIYDEDSNLIGTLGADATDGSTGLKVYDTSGNLIGFMGSGIGGSGIEINRPDGSLSFIARTSSGGFFGIYDRSGNYVITDDVDSAQGIARPYVPLGGFADVSYPTQTTTSSTFVTVANAIGYKQHPNVVAWVMVRADASTTSGEVRLTDASGTQIGSTAAITAGAFGFVKLGPAALAGSHESQVTVNLQIRRTAGTGAVGVRGVSLWGVESGFAS